MAGTIQRLEIFGAGTHSAQTGKVTVTEDDLDQIVDAFNSLQGSNIVRPHLKLGHTDAQKWFGQKDGIPALGWIEKVWREGKKLLANVKDVPDALLDMIRSGRYHNVSAELYMDAGIQHEGKTFQRVLSAVALLGAQMPAVKDLAGLASALFQTEPIHQFAGGAATSFEATKDRNMFTQEQVDSLVAAAVTKAVGEATAKFTTDLENVKKELGVKDAALTGAQAELTRVKAEAAQKEATTLVDQAIKDGKLLPKQREFALAALNATAVKVKFGDGEKSMPELFKDFLEASGKVIDTTEKGSGKGARTEFTSAADELDHEVKQLQAKDAKLEYAAAMDQVFTAKPELKQKYAESMV